MARKKRTVIIEDPEDSAPTAVDSQIEALEEQKEVERIELTDEWLTDFQQRFSDQPVRVTIEKYDESGDWSYCKKCPLMSFDLEIIKQEFGGGKYRATLFGPDGHYIKTGRRHFKVSDVLRSVVTEKKPDNPFENPMVVMMLKNMESHQTAMLELTKSMITAQAGKPQGITEIVEAMKGIHALSPKTDKPLESMKETLGLMKLIKEVSGDSEESGGLLSSLKEVLDVLPALKEQMASLKPAAAPGMSAPQAPGPVNPLPESISVTTGGPMDALTRKIVDLIPKFVSGAKANAPVTEWGNYLLEVVDAEVMPLLLPVLKERYKPLVQNEDDAYDLLMKYAKDPQERVNFFKTVPPLAPHKEWSLKVIDEAVRLLELPDEPIPANGSEILESLSD